MIFGINIIKEKEKALYKLNG